MVRLCGKCSSLLSRHLIDLTFALFSETNSDVSVVSTFKAWICVYVLNTVKSLVSSGRATERAFLMIIKVDIIQFFPYPSHEIQLSYSVLL